MTTHMEAWEKSHYALQGFPADRDAALLHLADEQTIRNLEKRVVQLEQFIMKYVDRDCCPAEWDEVLSWVGERRPPRTG